MKQKTKQSFLILVILYWPFYTLPQAHDFTLNTKCEWYDTDNFLCTIPMHPQADYDKRQDGRHAVCFERLGSLVWQIPLGSSISQHLWLYPLKQQRLRGLGPRLWSSHNSLKSQVGSGDFSPKGVSVLLFPWRTEPSHRWKWVNSRAKQWSPGCADRYSNSHLAALPRNTGNEKCITHWCTCSYFTWCTK